MCGDTRACMDSVCCMLEGYFNVGCHDTCVRVCSVLYSARVRVHSCAGLISCTCSSASSWLNVLCGCGCGFG